MKTKHYIGIVVLLVLAGLYVFTPVRDIFTLDSVVRLVERIKNNPWAPVLFTTAYIASCVLWPLTIFPVAGGVLFGFWNGFLLNTLAANVGAWITFFIARQFGREAVGKLMKGSLKTFDEQATRHGLWAIFAFRMLGFPPFLVTNYGSGLSGVRVRDYVLGTFLGMLAWTAIFSYFADTLWSAFTTAGEKGFEQAAGQFFWPLVGGLILVAIVVGITVLMRRRLASRKTSALAICLLAFAMPSNAQGGSLVDHSEFNRLLESYVKDGKVNYGGFQKEQRTFKNYMNQLKSIDPESLQNRDAKLAFWINAYNACVIQGVLDHFPLKSVMDVKGFFDKITYTVGGESLTLNQIEAKARAFGDPRVHFAVVCASSSCPILRAEAYVPERLDQQLQDQAHGFLASPQRGLRLDEAAETTQLSQIFKWYAADFVGGGFLAKLTGSGKILKALEPYMDEAARRKVEGRSWKIEYMPYDWSLNKQ